MTYRDRVAAPCACGDLIVVDPDVSLVEAVRYHNGTPGHRSYYGSTGLGYAPSPNPSAAPPPTTCRPGLTSRLASSVAGSRGLRDDQGAVPFSPGPADGFRRLDAYEGRDDLVWIDAYERRVDLR